MKFARILLLSLVVMLPTARPADQASDLQIVQPLTESQRKLLLHASSVDVTPGKKDTAIVTVNEPGNPPEQFEAKYKPSTEVIGKTKGVSAKGNQSKSNSSSKTAGTSSSTGNKQGTSQVGRGKLDLPARPTKSPNPPLNNPFKNRTPEPKTPNYVTYPCKVTNPKTGKSTWGVCVRVKF